MAAPQIPNLNTLRSGRGRGRGRGRGGSNGPPGQSQSVNNDHIVQQTDEDASVSRLSAVEVGYLEDPFAKLLFRGTPSRRYPIINRGTYVRTSAIDHLVFSFLAEFPSEPKQILSLGAGSDTRYFRLRQRSLGNSVTYHEVGFPTNTAQKISAIQSNESLKSLIGDYATSQEGTRLLSKDYNIHPLDLRELVQSSDSEPANYPSKSLLNLENLSAEIPTLILSECCLIYLPPASADTLLNHIGQTFLHHKTPISFVVYEPIHPNDSFGRVMISNLATRGIILQTLKKYGSRTRQRERLKMAGFTSGQAAADVNFIWNQWITDDEKERVSQVEMLDEIEEWQLLAEHYCVAWGWQDFEADSQQNQPNIFQRAWASIASQSEDDEGM